jgi:hypothetical protein
MVSMIVGCEKCGVIEELIIDSRNHKPLSNYICDTCIIEKREKLIISLTKKWWEFWK